MSGGRLGVAGRSAAWSSACWVASCGWGRGRLWGGGGCGGGGDGVGRDRDGTSSSRREDDDAGDGSDADDEPADDVSTSMDTSRCPRADSAFEMPCDSCCSSSESDGDTITRRAVFVSRRVWAGW